MTNKFPPQMFPYTQFLKNNKCGNCAWLKKGEGFSYCMLMDLYTERGLDDEACDDFVEVQEDGSRYDARFLERGFEVYGLENPYVDMDSFVLMDLLTGGAEIVEEK